MIPKLSEIQRAVKTMKQAKVAGLQLTSRYDLLQFCQKLLMPPPSICRQLVTNPSADAVTALLDKEYLCIPQDAAVFQVDGACFTGPTQIQWMKQLLKLQKNFTLHMDGKYKLHHGVWILITMGTHCLKVVGETTVTRLATTFVPLMYLFCKNHESIGACKMISAAIQETSLRCFGEKLHPGALMSDHSDGCRSGMLSIWPDTPHGQCWPHIIRKFGEGTFCSKKHPHFDVIPDHLRAIYLSQTPEMRDFFINEIGMVWDSWGSKWNLKSFWNEYCVQPWDNWSIGLFDCMLCTPSQQTQESWHKQILQSRIPGMFKGSTEHVMHVALPKLVSLDAALIADALLFEVPAVPRAMLQKAAWYANQRDTHIHVVKDMDVDADEAIFTFYILSQSSKTYKKIDMLLVTRYCSLLTGKKPRGLTKLQSFIDVADALHVVEYAEDAGRDAPPSELNPANLVCNCKGFRRVGICSHAMAVNHLLGELDVARLAGSMCTQKRKKGGFRHGVRPALQLEEPQKKAKRK